MTNTSPGDYDWIDELPERQPLPKGDRRVAIMIKHDKEVEEEDAEETSEES